MKAAAASNQRLDRWIWHARIVKTRSIAAGLVTSGFVRVNGERTEQPSRAIKPGDVLTIALPARVRVLKVTGILPRRGDASAAKDTYTSTEWQS